MNDEMPTAYYPLSVLDSLMLEQKRCEDDVVSLAVARAVAEERAVVVAYLAKCGLLGAAEGVREGDHYIERGEHRREEE